MITKHTINFTYYLSLLIILYIPLRAMKSTNRIIFDKRTWSRNAGQQSYLVKTSVYVVTLWYGRAMRRHLARREYSTSTEDPEGIKRSPVVKEAFWIFSWPPDTVVADFRANQKFFQWIIWLSFDCRLLKLNWHILQ